MSARLLLAAVALIVAGACQPPGHAVRRIPPHRATTTTVDPLAALDPLAGSAAHGETVCDLEPWRCGVTP